MNKEIKEALPLVALIVLLVFFILSGFGYLSDKQKDCHKRGGAFVRGVIGFECVAGPR